MIDRQNFKNFIDNVVVTYKNNLQADDFDLRVDAFGNFRVVFETITSSGEDSKFAESEEIKNLGDGLGALLFDKNTNLHKFIKNINDVELNINAKTLDLPGASYAIHRLMPMNSSPHIQMLWLNTKEPFIENVFVPWMEYNTILRSFPLLKCNLIITFPLLSKIEYSDNTGPFEVSYTYYGIRPIEVSLHKMTNEPIQDFYRRITFDFDYFLVNSHSYSD